jgi:hypothetical protein
MISERRVITFSRDALLSALRHYVVAVQPGLPSEQFRDVHPNRDGSCSLTIEAKSNRSRSTVVFTPTQMAAVLLTYAKHRSIPVPRRAQKSVCGDASGISLIVELEDA